MTKRVLSCLNQQVEKAKEEWSRGSYVRSDPNESHRVNMEVLTRVDALRGVVEMSYDDLKEAEEN